MKISVVIPCHNAAEYVGQTIGSLLEQTRPPDEIWVILDRSTDGSREVVRQFGDQVQVRSVNFGNAAMTRNFGAALCSGESLMFLDADDVLGPGALAGLEAALHTTRDAVALIPWKRLELFHGQWVERPASTPSRRFSQDLLANWLMGHYFPPCCVLWCRSAFAKTGGWSEEFCIDEDGDLAMRAMLLGCPFVVATSGYAYYRRVPKLQSLSGQRFSREGLSGRLRGIEKVAAWLEERARAHEYRLPLSVAFTKIRADCRRGGWIDLDSRGRVLQRQYAHVSPVLRARRALRAVALRGRSWLRGRWPRSSSTEVRKERRQSPGARIVPFGSHTAAAAARGTFLRTANRTDARQHALIAPAHVAATRATPCMVSVIIPTYNRAQLVCRAISSVLLQTYGDFEVLVVDDASTDDTEARVRALGDARIRYLRQPRNLDVSAARNRGLREARGQFIAFLDSDDEWLPEKLEQQLALMREAPDDVGLVYSGSLTRYDDGGQRVWHPTHRGDVLPEILLRNITDAGSASVLIRRNVIRVVGFFDEQIPAMEDYDYWIRIARFYRFEFVREPLVRYYEVPRDDRRSLISENDTRARQLLFTKFRSVLDRAGVTHRFLLASARRRLLHLGQTDRLGAYGLVARALVMSPVDRRSYREVYHMLFDGTVIDSLLTKLRGSRRRTSHNV